MKKILTGMALLFSASAMSEVAVIIHPDNPNVLDKETVSRLFLGKQRTFPNGESALVYALPNAHKATTEFIKGALDKNNTQWRAYWSKRMFTGKGRPPSVREDTEAMLKMVERNPNAVGFIDIKDVNKNVKVAMVF